MSRHYGLPMKDSYPPPHRRKISLMILAMIAQSLLVLGVAVVVYWACVII